jgi:hypothetical protein
MNTESHWTVYRTRFLVRARQLTEPLAFTDALGRDQSGRPGDYLVESSNGIRNIAPRTLFEDIYVPLEPSLPSLTQSRSSPQPSCAGTLDHRSPAARAPAIA